MGLVVMSPPLVKSRHHRGSLRHALLWAGAAGILALLVGTIVALSCRDGRAKPERLATCFWGEATTNVEWGEYKHMCYQYGRYVAELWNTCSNLPYIAFGVFGAVRYWSQAQWGGRLAYMFLAFTGVGSLFFHMTAKKWAEIWDEGGMLLFVACVLYEQRGMTPLTTGILGKIVRIFVVMSMVVVGAIYFCCDIFQIFSIGFGVYVTFASVMLFWFLGINGDVTNSKIYIILGAGSMAVGFAAWGIERGCCTAQNAWWLAHFHSIWHLGSGTAGYCLATFSVHARRWLDSRELKVI